MMSRSDFVMKCCDLHAEPASLNQPQTPLLQMVMPTFPKMTCSLQAIDRQNWCLGVNYLIISG